MITKEYLQEELNILEGYNRDRNSLTLKYISDRLNKSTKTYYNNIEETFKHLGKQDNLKLFKYLK